MNANTTTNTDNSRNTPRVDTNIAKRFCEFRVKYIASTMTEAAKLLNTTQGRISKMESGKQHINFDFIAKLQKEYDLNPDWLLNGNLPRVQKEKPRTLVTDMAEIMTELNALKKYVRILEVNQEKLFNDNERMYEEYVRLRKMIEEK